jgi:hypothetical protein
VAGLGAVYYAKRETCHSLTNKETARPARRPWQTVRGEPQTKTQDSAPNCLRSRARNDSRLLAKRRLEARTLSKRHGKGHTLPFWSSQHTGTAGIRQRRRARAKRTNGSRQQQNGRTMRSQRSGAACEDLTLKRGPLPGALSNTSRSDAVSHKSVRLRVASPTHTASWRTLCWESC